MKAFYNKYTECKISNRKRSLRLYNDFKDKISNQRETNIMKKIEKKLLQEQNNRYVN